MGDISQDYVFKKGDFVASNRVSSQVGWAGRVVVPEPDRDGSIIVQDRDGKYRRELRMNLDRVYPHGWIAIFPTGHSYIGATFPEAFESEGDSVTRDMAFDDVIGAYEIERDGTVFLYDRDWVRANFRDEDGQVVKIYEPEEYDL